MQKTVGTKKTVHFPHLMISLMLKKGKKIADSNDEERKKNVKNEMSISPIVFIGRIAAVRVKENS